jgi:hypothetical protein
MLGRRNQPVQEIALELVTPAGLPEPRAQRNDHQWDTTHHGTVSSPALNFLSRRTGDEGGARESVLTRRGARASGDGETVARLQAEMDAGLATIVSGINSIA